MVVCWTAHSGCGHGAEVGLVSVSMCECECASVCLCVSEWGVLAAMAMFGCRRAAQRSWMYLD